MLNGLVTAFRTLTVIPVPGKEADRKYHALPWFLLVGTVLGAMQAAVAWGILPALAGGTGLILVIINYVLTGALHLDGLADTADAFGTVHTREKTLEILKDPRMGTFGIGAIVIAILCRMFLYQRLTNSAQGLMAVVTALGLARVMQGLLLCWFPYGRGQEGKAFGFKGGRIIQVFLVLEVFCITVAFVLRTGAPYRTVSALAAGCLAIAPVVYGYLRRLDGITGDCVGACTEVFEVAFLTVMAA